MKINLNNIAFKQSSKNQKSEITDRQKTFRKKENNHNLKKNGIIAAVSFGGVLSVFALNKNKIAKLIKKIKPAKKIINPRWEIIKHFPPLAKYCDEMDKLDNRMKIKWKNAAIPGDRGSYDYDLLDVEYYKDFFRLHTLISAERARIIRETNDPKMKELFYNDIVKAVLFSIDHGMMIHGSNKTEKEKLLNYFITEAEKAGMDVVHIKAEGDEFYQDISYLLPQAKEKFLKEQKHTLFVMEDVDSVLHHSDNGHIGGGGRAPFNKHVQECGKQGISVISTADDINNLDESSIREGRITYKINIDKALEASRKAKDQNIE